jgi:hypothetical protein
MQSYTGRVRLTIYEVYGLYENCNFVPCKINIATHAVVRMWCLQSSR